MGLTSEEVKSLLEKELSRTHTLREPRYIGDPEYLAKYPRIKQQGPVRWRDREMRCVSKGCGTSTYVEVDRIPLCTIHAIRELNDMVHSLTLRLKPGV
jgi:hypothetical protein